MEFLNEAIKNAQKNSEKRTSISVQMKESQKIKFEELCKKNKVSMAAMLNGFIDKVVNEYEIELATQKKRNHE